MVVPVRHPGGSPAIQLLRGDVKDVARWAAGGVVPVHVVPLGEWTALLPAGASRAAAPYDEHLPLLVARRVPSRVRAALGFFVIDGRAVVTVQPGGWRPVTRWAVWDADAGVLRSTDLPLARPQDLTRAAGQRDPRAGAQVRDLLRRPGDDPREMLDHLVRALGLPGGELLSGERAPAQIEGAVRIDPDERGVTRFDRVARDHRPQSNEPQVDR